MNDLLTFVRPLIGLERIDRFALVPVDGAPGLLTLRSPDGIRLFVLDAAVHLPAYQPKLSQDQLAAVAGDRERLRVLVVVTPAAERSTANLAAPILVNDESGEAAQVILEGDEWPLRYSLAA